VKYIKVLFIKSTSKGLEKPTDYIFQSHYFSMRKFCPVIVLIRCLNEKNLDLLFNKPLANFLICSDQRFSRVVVCLFRFSRVERVSVKSKIIEQLVASR